MSQAIAYNHLIDLARNPLSEYQSHKNSCSNVTNKISSYSSVVLPVLTKICANIAAGASVGGLLATFGAQTTETESPLRIIEAAFGIRTTFLGVGTLILATAITGLSSWVDTEEVGWRRTKVTMSIVAATILGTVLETKIFEIAKKTGPIVSVFLPGAGTLATGVLAGWWVTIAGESETTGMTIATTIILGGVSTLMGILSAEEGAVNVLSSGVRVGALIGFLMRSARILITKERGAICKALSLANDRISRATRFPFFRALLVNYLNALPTREDKENFLDSYQLGHPSAHLQFAEGYLQQLLKTEEALIEENTPDFFQRNLTLEGREMTLMGTINEMKQKINAERRKRERLFKEEKTPVEAQRNNPHLSPEISQKILSIAHCLINTQEINAVGVPTNPTIPDLQEIALVRADYFGPSIRII